ncbi:MAG: hypothetical protein Q9204_007037, partial [Flavoplaca sp. TL-2023a]
MPTLSDDPLTTLRQLLSHYNSLPSSSTYFLAPFLHSSLHLTSVSLTPTPTVTATFTVPTSLCNTANNLHGGATASIFDVVTTYAIMLISKRGFWETPGVSRTLDVVYLEAVGEGEEVEVLGEVVKVGR